MTHILVVEDDLLISMWMEDTLAEAGFGVSITTNADQAVTLLEAGMRVDVVVTDIDMPGSMDGLRLASLVRDRWPPVHIVIASGKHRPSSAEMPSGALFLPKPFLTDEIVRAIEARP